MSKLHELTSAANAIYDKILDDDANLDTLEDTLQCIEGAIEAKAESMVRFVQMLDADSDAISAEIKRLQLRKLARENRADRIKAYLKAQLEQIGKDKITTSLFTVAIQNNPPSLLIDHPEAVPAQYLTLVPERYEVNRAALKDALKNGAEVVGCRLERGTHLRIR